MIESSANPRIKNLIRLSTKAKARKEQDCYIVEGIKMFLEIPEGYLLETYVSAGFLKEKSNEKMLEGIRYEAVCDKVFKSISDTVTPQGIMAVVKRRNYRLEELLADVAENEKERKCFLILDDIRDPGNLGTIIRTAEGAGVTGVILSRETVDMYNPKVIRSTMGSIFRVPFFYSEDLKETICVLKDKGIKIFSAHLEGENMYEKLEDLGNIGLVVGNESNGISEEIKKISDELIRIPMCGKVESLNAAVSGALIMYSFLHKC